MSSTAPQIQFVDTVDLVQELVTEIVTRDKKPLLFVDLEGVNLSRDGSVAIMQVLVPPNPTVYLIDVHVLQHAAFETMTADGHTWKAILESPSYAKVFFDVRNDSDALYCHFAVSLRGVIDLQLLEFVTRPGRNRPRYVQGLAKCISYSRILSPQDAQIWEQVKNHGRRQFAPEEGGAYEVFLRRPLSTAMQEYCAEDVLKMPPLLCFYAGLVEPHLAHQVALEALRRVELSQSPAYNPHGPEKAVGPSVKWQRTRFYPALVFPMALVCSADLATYCDMTPIAPKEPPLPLAKDAALPEAAPPAQPLSLDEIAKITQQLQQADIGAGLHRGGQLPVDEDDNDDGDDYDDDDDDDLGGYLGASYSDGFQDSDKDYTACSADDCGWCGHCHY